MKRIIILILSLTMIISMAVTANAVTPVYKPPKLPEIKVDTSSIKVEVSQSFWDKWFAEHPIVVSYTAHTLGLGSCHGCAEKLHGMPVHKSLPCAPLPWGRVQIYSGG